MSNINAGNNKRIAKNTIFLYFRMAVVMIVKFYIARVLLEALGVQEYGVWNLLASFVISFQFISAPIVVSTQRFLNYDMGQGGNRLTSIFNLSFELILIVSILLTIVLETAGLWFVEHKMNFPPESANSVELLYQLTILSLVFQLVQKPFESIVIAHEKMSFYAYIAFFEVIVLLVITIMLKCDISDNKLLIWYGAMNLVLYVTEFLIYIIYCHRRFSCCKFRLCWDRKQAKEIAVFSGWNLFGGLSSMTANEGVNVLLNIFFNVVVNAAFGIATQIRGAINLLIGNLQKAFDPQIVKNYSLGNTARFHSLTLGIITFSYILALVVVFPLCWNIDFILTIWLGNDVPRFASIFSILTLLQMLFVALGGPIDTAIFATGKIKSYQLWLSGEIFLNIVICYILFRLSYGPISAFIVKLLVGVMITFTRLLFLSRVGISFGIVVRKVLLPLLVVSLLSCGIAAAICSYISFSDSWIGLLGSTLIFELLLVITVWGVVLDNDKRQTVIRKVKTIFIR